MPARTWKWTVTFDEAVDEAVSRKRWAIGFLNENYPWYKLAILNLMIVVSVLSIIELVTGALTFFSWWMVLTALVITIFVTGLQVYQNRRDPTREGVLAQFDETRFPLRKELRISADGVEHQWTNARGSVCTMRAPWRDVRTWETQPDGILIRIGEGAIGVPKEAWTGEDLPLELKRRIGEP